MKVRSSRPTPRRPAIRRLASITALSCAAATILIAPNAHAGPGTKGVRHLGMGEASRASATGTDAAMNNPSGLGLTQQFAITPGYQIFIPDLTHGISAYILDSLNNPRFSLALGYEFLKGTPKVGYLDSGGETQDFDLSYFGHEVGASINVAAIMGWWWLAIKPKFQYTSLRYLDDEGKAIDATPRLRSFGFDVATTMSFKGWVNVAFVAENLVGNNGPAWTEDDPITIEGVEEFDDATNASLDLSRVRRVSDYPLKLTHAISIQPLRTSTFSLNFDGSYDFTSYKDQDKKVRTIFAGGGEFVIREMIPIRAGVTWDGRGRGRDDDKLYVGGGLGFIKTPKVGGTGVDIGVSFQQQVQKRDDSPLETTVGLHIGLRFHPDL